MPYTDIVISSAIGNVSLLVDPTDINVSVVNDFSTSRSATGKRYITFYGGAGVGRCDKTASIAGATLAITQADNLLQIARSSTKVAIIGSALLNGSDWVVTSASRSPESPGPGPMYDPNTGASISISGVYCSYNISLVEVGNA